MLSKLVVTLTSLFSATTYQPTTVPWVVGNMFNQAGLFFINLWQIICTGFYWVCKWLLALVDFLQYFIQKLIGLDYWLSNSKYTLEGATGNDLLFNFLFNDTVQKVFRALLGVFFVLLIIFTIFAIVKQEWSYITGNDFGNGKGNSKGQILRGSLKAIALVLVFPIVLCAGIISSNAILASLIKALSIDMSSTFGNTLFYASSMSANRYRIYANNDYRGPVSDTVSFYVITDTGGEGSAFASDNGKVLILGNSTYSDKYVRSVTTYSEYLSILPYCTKYSVDSMIPVILAKDEGNFNGYCIRLDKNGKEMFYMVKVTETNSNKMNYGRGFVNTKEAWYYYLNNILQVPIMNSAADGDLGKGGLLKEIKGCGGKFGDAVNGDRCYISGCNLKEVDPHGELERASFNTYDYPTIYENNNVKFDYALNNTVLRSGSDDWSVDGGATSTSLLSYIMGHTNISNARLYYNSDAFNGYFDGGQLGVNSLKSEYYVMADVVDFMLENKLELYMLDSTSEIIDWNYGNYSIDQRWTNKNNVLLPESYSNSTANKNNPNAKYREVKPFVVSYSEKCGDEFGNALYLADCNAHNELYGSVYIMCIKISENKFIPLINGKAFKDADENSYTFRSNYYSSNYNGVVIAKGTFTVNYDQGKENKPTYLASNSLSGGSSFDELTSLPYFYDIEKSGSLKQYALEKSKIYTSKNNFKITSISTNSENATFSIYDKNNLHPGVLTYQYCDNEGKPKNIANEINDLKIYLENVDNGNTSVAEFYDDENKNSSYLFCDESGGFFIAEIVNDLLMIRAMDNDVNNTTDSITLDYMIDNSFKLIYKDYGLYYDYVDETKNIHITNNLNYSPDKFTIFNDPINVNVSNISFVKIENNKYLFYYDEPIDIVTSTKINTSTGTFEPDKYETTYFHAQFEGKIVSLSSDGLNVNFAVPTKIEESSHESIFFTMYYYNYNTGVVGEDNGNAEIKEIEWTTNGPAIKNYGNTTTVPKPTDEKFMTTFKIDSNFVWGKDETRYALYDGKTFIGTIYKSRDQEVNIDNLHKYSTRIDTNNYETYENLRVNNHFKSTDDMVSYYSKKATSLRTQCIRDNETYWGAYGEFHFKALFNLNILLKFMPISLEKEVVVREFKITEGINYDYFFDGAYALDDFYLPSKINFIILIFASALIIKILGTSLWGVIKRFYEITLYFLATPAVASTIPLDNGSRFTRSIQQPLIGKVMSTYGIMLGINMFFVLLVPIRSMSNVFTAEDIAQSGSYFLKHLSWILSPEILNLYVYILFLLVAFTLINTLPKTITDIVGAGDKSDVVKMGADTKQQVGKDMKSAADFTSGKSLIEGTKKSAGMLAAAVPGGALVKGAFKTAKKGVDKVRNRGKKANDEAQKEDGAESENKKEAKSSREDGDEMDTSAENEGRTDVGGGDGGNSSSGGGGAEGGGDADISFGGVGNFSGKEEADAAEEFNNSIYERNSTTTTDADGNSVTNESYAGSEELGLTADQVNQMILSALQALADGGNLAAKSMIVKDENGNVDKAKTIENINNGDYAEIRKLAEQQAGGNLAMGLSGGAPQNAAEGLILDKAAEDEDMAAEAALNNMISSKNIGAFAAKYGLDADALGESGEARDNAIDTIKNLQKSGSDSMVNDASKGSGFEAALGSVALAHAQAGTFKFSAWDMKKAIDSDGAEQLINSKIPADDPELRALEEAKSLEILKKDPIALYDAFINKKDLEFRDTIVDKMVAKNAGLNSDEDYNKAFAALKLSPNEILKLQKMGLTSEQDIALAAEKAKLAGKNLMNLSPEEFSELNNNALVGLIGDDGINQNAIDVLNESLDDDTKNELLKSQIYDENGNSIYKNQNGGNIDNLKEQLATERKLAELYNSQKDMINNEALIGMFKNGTASDDAKQAVIDRLTDSYQVTDAKDEENARNFALRDLLGDKNYTSKDKVDAFLADDNNAAEFNNKYAEHLDRINRQKLAAGYGQKQDIKLGMILDSDRTMNKAEDLYTRMTNGKELKHASETERNKFLLDNFGDKFEKDAQTRLDYLISKGDIEDPKSVYLDIMRYNNNDSEINAKIMERADIGRVIKDMAKDDQGSAALDLMKQDYIRQNLEKGDLTVEKDVSKMSGNEKNEFNFNLNMLQQQINNGNTQLLQNIFNNSNFLGKDEIKDELKRITLELAKDRKGNVNAGEALQLYLSKHQDTKQHLMNMAAGDVTLSLDKNDLLNKEKDVIKNNPALLAEISKKGLDISTLSQKNIDEMSAGFKALLNKNIKAEVAPSSHASQEQIDSFFAAKAIQDGAPIKKNKKKQHLPDTLKEFFDEEEDTPQFKANRKGVLYKHRSKLPEQAAAYNNWNVALERHIKDIKSGKGQFATLSADERNAKIDELEAKKIYQNKQKSADYYNMTNEEQQAWDKQQSLLKKEALNTVNPSEIYNWAGAVTAPKNRNLVLKAADAIGSLKFVPWQTKENKEQHKRDLAFTSERIDTYNSTKGIRNDSIEFGDEKRFSQLTKTYLSAKSASSVEKEAKFMIDRLASGLVKDEKGNVLADNAENRVKIRKEILENKLGQQYMLASKKVAKDNKVNKVSFLEEKGIGDQVVRYSAYKKNRATTKSFVKAIAITNAQNRVEKGGAISNRIARLAAKGTGSETLKLRLRNEASTIKSQLDSVGITAKNIKDKAKFAEEMKAKLGPDLYKKIYGKKGIGGGLENKSIAIQQRDVMKALEEQLGQVGKRLKTSAPFISATKDAAKEFVGKNFGKVTSKAEINFDKVKAEDLNKALKTVMNGQKNNLKFDQILGQVKNQLPDLAKNLSKFKGTSQLQKYLDDELTKANRKVVNNATLKADKHNLTKLNGVRVDKNEVFRGGMSPIMVKAMDSVNKQVYSNIMRSYNQAKAKKETEEMLRKSLAKEYNRLSGMKMNSKTKAEMQKVWSQMQNSKIRLGNLDAELDKALARKKSFENKYASKQISAAKSSGSKVGVSSNAKVTGRYDFFTKGGQKVVKGSVTDRQVEEIARRFVMQNKANLERMYKSLNDKTQADLKAFIKRQTDKLSSDFGANINTLKNVQSKLKREIKKYNESSDKKAKQLGQEIKLNKRRTDDTEKELISKLQELGIEIKDIKLK